MRLALTWIGFIALFIYSAVTLSSILPSYYSSSEPEQYVLVVVFGLISLAILTIALIFIHRTKDDLKNK
jgi:hypothetical protein